MLNRLSEDDVNIVFHNRVANLKKVYPYIPDSLNRVLMHFCRGRAPCTTTIRGSSWEGPGRGEG